MSEQPTALESLVTALLDAGPEAAEHVVNAARELVLAATTIVDALEHAFHEQQDLRRREPRIDSDHAEAAPAETTQDEDAGLGDAGLRDVSIADQLAAVGENGLAIIMRHLATAK